MKLDVGCGYDPKGTVNVDRYRFTNQMNPKGTPTLWQKITRKPYPSMKTKADVICDALHLPFKDNCFDVVYSNSCIEHTDNPMLFMEEAKRVTKKEIEIIAPHRFGRSAKEKYHKSFLNIQWFTDACGILNLKIVSLRTTIYRPHIFYFYLLLEKPETIMLKAEKQFDGKAC